MSNPFARLLAQAELGAADMARRSIANVTEPIRAKSQEVIAEVVETASAAARTIAIKAVLGLFAAAMAVTAIVYALSALYAYLLQVTDPVKALLIMAGLFAALTLVAVLALVFWPSAKPKAKPTMSAAKLKADAAQVAAASLPARSTVPVAPAATGPTMANAQSVDLASGFEAVASILGAAGFRREQAGLRAGMALANQLRPMQLVALAVIGGFVAGLRVTNRRRRD